MEATERFARNINFNGDVRSRIHAEVENSFADDLRGVPDVKTGIRFQPLQPLPVCKSSSRDIPDQVRVLQSAHASGER